MININNKLAGLKNTNCYTLFNKLNKIDVHYSRELIHPPQPSCLIHSERQIRPTVHTCTNWTQSDITAADKILL